MELPPLYVTLFGLGTTLALVVLLRLLQRLGSPAKANTAQRLLQVGQVLAAFLVAAAAVKGGAQGESVTRDVTWVALFGVVALGLVLVTANLGIRLLMQSKLPA